MWTDDLEIVESCGFDLSLSYFDSINSIGVFSATDTFAHMKTPNLRFFLLLYDIVCRGRGRGEDKWGSMVTISESWKPVFLATELIL